MTRYGYLKKKESLYSNFGLPCNPFSIAPLFRDFKQISQCELEERLFVLPERLEREVPILLEMEDRRVLVHGLYGVGKTSFVDFLLYIAHNFRKRFCTRVIVTENNAEKAINEMLLSLCFDILSEIDRKKITRPLESIRKWITGRRCSDFLLSSMLRLMGEYSEYSETESASKKKGRVKLSAKIIEGDAGYEREITLRKGMQSYVEILPMRKIAEYLEDFLEIIRLLDFQNIVIFIDEADHLQKIDMFLKLLTRSREVLFSSGYTFFVAGSVEIAKYTESMGAIFDKLMFIKTCKINEMREILESRVNRLNPNQKLLDVFEEDALSLIFEQSRGIQKEFLRMAENALDEAIMAAESKIELSHCMRVLKTSEDEVTLNLTDSQMRVLRAISRRTTCSASDKELQKATEVGRTYLRMVMEGLVEKGYLLKERRGKQSYYSISSQYRSYFQQLE